MITIPGVIKAEFNEIHDPPWIIEGDVLTVECDNPGLTSDGYHTFDELYKHRCYLFAIVLKRFSEYSWKALKHDDGSSYDGWFICGTTLLDKPITYHFPMEMWELVKVKELDKAPPFDGHSSNDVLDRIEEYLKC